MFGERSFNLRFLIDLPGELHHVGSLVLPGFVLSDSATLTGLS